MRVPGDAIVLYSDGITDHLSAAGHEYGKGRLAHVLRAQLRPFRRRYGEARSSTIRTNSPPPPSTIRLFLRLRFGTDRRGLDRSFRKVFTPPVGAGHVRPASGARQPRAGHARSLQCTPRFALARGDNGRMIIATSQPTRYQTLFSDGEHGCLSDVSADKGGQHAGFRPHALLEAALASCVGMTVRMYADHHAIPLRSVTAKVTLDRSQPDEIVFRYEVDVDGDLTPEQKDRLLHAASACPVRKTLSKKIRFEGGAGARYRLTQRRREPFKPTRADGVGGQF